MPALATSSKLRELLKKGAKRSSIARVHPSKEEENTPVTFHIEPIAEEKVYTPENEYARLVDASKRRENILDDEKYQSHKTTIQAAIKKLVDNYNYSAENQAAVIFAKEHADNTAEALNLLSKNKLEVSNKTCFSLAQFGSNATNIAEFLISIKPTFNLTRNNEVETKKLFKLISSFQGDKNLETKFRDLLNRNFSLVIGLIENFDKLLDKNGSIKEKEIDKVATKIVTNPRVENVFTELNTEADAALSFATTVAKFNSRKHKASETAEKPVIKKALTL